MSKKTGLILLVVVLIVGAILAYYAKRYYDYIYGSNLNLENKEYTFIHIPSGSNYDSLINILESKQILNCLESFDFVAERKNYKNRVLSGRYRVYNQMSNNELVNLLRSGSQEPINLSFISLRSLELLAGRVATFIEADSLSLINLMRNPDVQAKYGFCNATIKAMFIPNTYQFFWNTSANRFMERMSDEHKRYWNKERLEKAEKAGLTPIEVSILASIVEAETQKNDEKARIAGVYINRLKRGWKLQADPTVVFAMGDFTIRRVLRKYLQTDSPYNTYMYQGLPPGPINIPSTSSIEAVLNYENHSYFYFCAKDDFSGYHSFARTLSEHNANARRYHEALRRANIRR